MNPMFNIQSLSGTDWQYLMPIIILTCSGLISLLLSTIKNSSADKINFVVFILGCSFSMVCLLNNTRMEDHSIQMEGYTIQNGTFYFDNFSNIFSIILITLVCFISTFEVTKMKENFIGGEFFALLSFALVGMIGLISSKDFMMIFICLELMSLATYILIALRRVSKESAESSLKYFILGGVMSAVLLMGLSFVFGATGSFNLSEINNSISTINSSQHVVLMFGILLIYIAMLFKVGAFPFHTWLPDVYSGASNTISAFMITAVKITAFALIVRVSIYLWVPQIFGDGTKMHTLLYVVALMSLALGAFVGLRQNNLKRIFAYSSIAHTGFILMGLICLKGNENSEAFNSIIAYLLFYVVAAFGAFAFLHLLKEDVLKNYDLENLNGLYHRSPVVAICLTVFLLSMAGIPPTIGFFGKYYVILVAIKSGELTLAIAAILSSLTAAYFYIRPIANMFFKESNATSDDLYEEKFNVKALMVGACCLVLMIPLFYNILS